MKNRRDILFWQTFTEKYLHFVPDTISYCENAASKLFAEKKRTLGIKCRGTDYNSLSAKGHPIQPKVEQVIEKAKWVMKKYRCERIYLSTEDTEIIKRFQIEFGNRILISESVRSDYELTKETCISLYSSERNNDKYLKGLEYVRDIYLFSKCCCLIGGINGGSAAALLMKKNYEYTYFWYIGRY